MKTIYLPSPTNPYVSTLGERHYFKSKVWKLLVIYGIGWSDMNWTLKGFSIFNMGGNSFFNEVRAELDKRGIKYTCLYNTWSTNINISTRKKNLEIIDKWYDEFYNEQIQYVHDNHFWTGSESYPSNKYYDEESMNHLIEALGERHYKPSNYIKL